MASDPDPLRARPTAATGADSIERLYLDSDGYVARHSAGAPALLGIEAMKLAASHISDTPWFRTVAERMLATVRAIGEPVQLDITRDGYLPLCASASLHDDADGSEQFEIRILQRGAVPRMEDRSSDLSEALEWQHTLADAIDMASIGLLVHWPDDQGRPEIRHVNSAASLILGLPPDELVGSDKFVGDAPVWDDDGFRHWSRPDGAPRILKVTTDAGRRLFGRRTNLVFIQDFTVQQRREQHRRQLLAELGQKNEDLAVFSRSMAHDLKEPIRNMALIASMLKEQNELPEPASRMLSLVEETGARATVLVNRLLEFMNAGESSVNLKPVDLNQVVEAIRTDLDEQIAASDVRLHVSASGQLIADPDLVRVLLQNLISNAMRYNESDRPKVKIAHRRQDGKEILTVEDNGIGIPEGREEEAFQAFRRLHTGSDRSHGSGLGLATCRRIATVHGGTIHAENIPQGGARIVVSWPYKTMVDEPLAPRRP